MRIRAFLATFALSLCSCTHTGNGPQDMAEAAAAEFAEAYFNYHYKDAAAAATADSRKWLEYAASNVTQGDVDKLRSAEEDATVEIVSSAFEDDSRTKCAVRVNVGNFLRKDSINGKPGGYAKNACFLLRVELDEGTGRWLVRMAGLPRSEK